MGFALNAFQQKKDTVINNDAIYNGQQINQSRTDFGKGTGIQTSGLLKYDNKLSLALAGDGVNNQALNTELGTLDSLEPKNLDGFRAFA